MRQTDANAQTRDLAAFIALALETIAGTIDTSVTAWEKRGYWVKADRFRMELFWAEILGTGMRQAVIDEDWMKVAQLSAQGVQKLSTVQVPQLHPLDTPWQGAYQKLQAASK